VQPKIPVLTSGGELYADVALDENNAARVRDYWRAVWLLFDSGESSGLLSLGPIAIIDVAGVQYELLTDVDALLHLFEQLSDNELDGLRGYGDLSNPSELESGGDL